MVANRTYGVTGGNIYYEVNEFTNTITIAKCDASVTEAVIPSKINDIPVTSIGWVLPFGLPSDDSAFAGCSNLTSITIPDSVTTIGGYAFYGCSGLTSITIPGSVTTVGEDAFSGCSNLTDVYYSGTKAQWDKNIRTEIASSDENLADATLHYIGPNTSVIWPVTGGNLYFSPEEGMITYCDPDVTEVTIPSEINGKPVTSIGNWVFQGCSSLASVTIEGNITNIGEYAFADCSSLTSITLPDGVTTIGDDAFSGCSSLTSITLPDSVTSIGYSAFQWCKSLASITIPDGITKIYSWTFSGCSSLTHVYYSGTESQWEEIVAEIELWYDNDDPLASANIHFNSVE